VEIDDANVTRRESFAIEHAHRGDRMSRFLAVADL
jgi:hypothetical protein